MTFRRARAICVALILINVTSGCNNHAREEEKSSAVVRPVPIDQRRVIVSDFNLATWDDEKNTSRLEMTYKDDRVLREVNVTITIAFENGSSLSIKRFWATWEMGERKVVPIEPVQGLDQKIAVKGQCRRDESPVGIEAEFTRKPTSEVGKKSSAPANKAVTLAYWNQLGEIILQWGKETESAHANADKDDLAAYFAILSSICGNLTRRVTRIPQDEVDADMLAFGQQIASKFQDLQKLVAKGKKGVNMGNGLLLKESLDQMKRLVTFEDMKEADKRLKQLMKSRYSLDLPDWPTPK